MKIIKPNWPAPNWVHAFTTTREEGLSKKPYDKCNLAHHVGEDVVPVSLNRQRMTQLYHLNPKMTWLNQTHSDKVIELTKAESNTIEADGVWTRKHNLTCAVLTADCLPMLFTDSAGGVVGAIHCGWRGIAKGIIEQTMNQVERYVQGNLLVWLGPAIGPTHFEVGKDVYHAFVDEDYETQRAFVCVTPGSKWLANIFTLARIKLYKLGIDHTYGGEYCTYRDKQMFYSSRRQKITGRMASLIAIHPLGV